LACVTSPLAVSRGWFRLTHRILSIDTARLELIELILQIEDLLLFLYEALYDASKVLHALFVSGSSDSRSLTRTSVSPPRVDNLYAEFQQNILGASAVAHVLDGINREIRQSERAHRPTLCNAPRKVRL
jgi:hypothetical protein